MAITSLGVGSGLDLAGILNQMYAQATARTKTIDAKVAGANTQISDIGKLQSALSAFKDSLKNLANPSAAPGLSGLSAASSDPATVSSLAVSAGAVQSQVAVNVLSLASPQKISSLAFSAADPNAKIGAGTFSVSFGTAQASADQNMLASGSFSPSGQTASFTLQNASLNDLKDALNSTGKLRASVINDGSAWRLSVSSAQSGASGAFEISTSASSGAFANGVLDFSFASAQNYKTPSLASDLHASVDGVSVSSSTNAVSGAVPGLSFTALKTGQATLSVSSDPSLAQKNIGDFVSKWNVLNDMARSLTSYDPSSKKAGSLFGESQAQNLMLNARRALFSSSFGSGSFNTLNSIGIKADSKGALSIDAAAFSKALAQDPGAAANLFSSAAAGSALDKVFEAQLGPSSGLSQTAARIAKQTASLSEQKQQILDMADAQKQALQNQFAALDALMSKSNSLTAFLTKNFG